MAAPDPYLPGHGDDRYRVRHYDLRLGYKVTTNRLDEVAVLDVELLTDLKQLELDLYRLQVSKVLVDGSAARFRTRNHKLQVELRSRRAGERIEVTVHCSGKPRPVPGVHGAAGWEELTDGVLVGSQPQGAPGWFPCNDDPADKASYRIQLDVAAGYHVVANGSLTSKQRHGGTTRWVYEMDAPMAPYLATVQVGHYVTTDLPGPVPVQIVHPSAVAVGAGTAFEHQAEMVRHFVDLFGLYPFGEYRAVVADDVLEIPLEAQGLSSFGRNFAQPTWDNERLVAHELAHQWFGNSVTANQLADIWLHEGFACYAEWLWADHRAATDPHVLDVQAQAARHHTGLAQQKQDLVLTAPGMPDMFDDRVYKRGALTLHAVRAILGDESFFRMLQAWATDHAGGVVTTEMFVEHCLGFATDDPAPLAEALDAWLNRGRLPALPVLSR
ncbi:M1 family metallopeptidase [Luteococcus peritonei]|uniref:Aminopeptidase N n=1 Tax=Luteococcus peritonei TaxID=88874 RepID=A0ABW4RX14_9ACTN